MFLRSKSEFDNGRSKNKMKSLLRLAELYSNMKVTHSIHLPSLPVAEALKNFQDRLTRFEQEEIMDYSEIWFMGLSSQKIEGSQGAPQNCGYDDEHGSYIRVMWKIALGRTGSSFTVCKNSLSGHLKRQYLAPLHLFLKWLKR